MNTNITIEKSTALVEGRRKTKTTRMQPSVCVQTSGGCKRGQHMLRGSVARGIVACLCVVTSPLEDATGSEKVLNDRLVVLSLSWRRKDTPAIIVGHAHYTQKVLLNETPPVVMTEYATPDNFSLYLFPTRGPSLFLYERGASKTPYLTP